VVRDAAYTLLREHDLRTGHRAAAEFLGAAGREEHLFDIVLHRTLGAAQIDDPSERLALARLNLEAGRKAKRATAYQAAASYFAAGIGLLASDCWSTEYELTFALHVERAECEYLNHRYPEAEGLFNDLAARVANNLDDARLNSLRMELYSLLGRMPDSLRVGRESLFRLGIELPQTPEQIQQMLFAELGAIGQELAGRPIEQWALAPAMNDPEKLAAQHLLTSIAPSAYFANPMLLALVVVKHVNLSLRHGNSDVSAFGYSAYSVLLIGLMTRYAEAFEVGRLAMALLERFPNANLVSRVNFLFGCHISPFRQPLHHTLEHAERARTAGLAFGDLVFGSYAAYHRIVTRLDQGHELSQVRDEIQKGDAIIKQTKDAISQAFVSVCRQFVANLEGKTESRLSLNDASFREASFLQELDQAGFATVAGYYYTLKLQLAYLYGDYAQAMAMAEEAEKRAPSAMAVYYVTDISFYLCLTLSAIYREAPADAQPGYLARFQEHQARIAACAESCPTSFAHKRALIAAESARISGQPQEAMTLYGEAISLAEANQFTHHAALANELCARFHLQLEKPGLARSHGQTALAIYSRWGAQAKLVDMSERLPQLL
jgi:predicted ATPase